MSDTPASSGAAPPFDTTRPFDTTPSPGGRYPSGTPHSERKPVRVATIVWGAILIAISVGVIAVTLGATVDVELALIVGLGAAGLALVVGSTVASVRRGR